LKGFPCQVDWQVKEISSVITIRSSNVWWNMMFKILKSIAFLSKKSSGRSGPSAADSGLLKAAESAFGFWDNPEDQIFDS
jgi:hypothetical protein